jgi:redox-sensitive bicupin YhaK (pirin superfamily)
MLPPGTGNSYCTPVSIPSNIAGGFERDRVRPDSLAGNALLFSRAEDDTMITIRPSNERGHFDHGWLDTYHTFSFADYHDPGQMGFRTLRVINDDKVAPGMGFGRHPHRDMEIITYVLDGSLEHRDSMGNGSVIRPGDVQRMSAGTGVLHSERNPSDSEGLHLLQIWILPEQHGIRPGYEQKNFSVEERKGTLRLVASPTGEDGAVTIHQDVRLYAGILDGETVTHAFGKDRHGWLHVAKGTAELNGRPLTAGDGAAISGEDAVTVSGHGEVLLFDLN